MKSFFPRLFVLVIASLFAVPLSLFASPTLTPPINANTSSTVNPQNFGQTHSYTVLLRGNSEVVTWATVTLTNGNTAAVSQLVLKTGNISPRLFEAWQEIPGPVTRKGTCRNPNIPTYPYAQETTEESCTTLGSGYIFYPSPTPAPSGYRYEKLTVQQSGKTATVTLSKSVAQNATGTIIINYRGFGAVKKGLFGRMTFDVQTLEASDRVRSARVVVDADTDLYIKGDKAKISYVEDAASYGKSGGVALEQVASTGLSSSALSRDIGYYQSSRSITKTATDLLAGDVFHVRGVYSTSQFGMYYPTVATTILIIAVIILAIIFGRKYWNKMHPLRQSSSEASPPKTNAASQSGQSKTSDPTTSATSFMHTMWGSGIIGFLNAIGTGSLTFLIPYLMQSFAQQSYGNGYGSEFYGGLMMLFALVSFLLVVVMAFGPSVYFGIRYGRNYGFIVFGSQILFLFFFFIFLGSVLSVLSNGRGYMGGIGL
ncbi:MAG TPA: hypothetical protein VJC11_03105 [Patescibacteria group bacterium]|nr:hypothetical protein [Patescibacteria group bacterium]